MSNTKEIKNFLEKMFKNSAKSYGYKVISGIPYKEINGALFDIILQTSTSKDGVQMRCSLHYKPLYCDYALWAVMGVDYITIAAWIIVYISLWLSRDNLVTFSSWRKEYWQWRSKNLT